MTTRHHVATEQVGRELTMRNDVAASGIFGDLIGLEKDKDADKDETRNRINELATFALCGFGFFKTLVGTGAYNRERKSTHLRQAVTERGKFWELGLRVPIGHRLADASATLSWVRRRARNFPTIRLCWTTVIIGRRIRTITLMWMARSWKSATKIHMPWIGFCEMPRKT